MEAVRSPEAISFDDPLLALDMLELEAPAGADRLPWLHLLAPVHLHHLVYQRWLRQQERQRVQDQMQALLLSVRILHVPRLLLAASPWTLARVAIGPCSLCVVRQLLDDLAEQLQENEPTLAECFDGVNDDLALDIVL